MKRFFAVLLSVSMFGIWSCTHDRSFDEAGAQGQPFDKCPVDFSVAGFDLQQAASKTTAINLTEGTTVRVLVYRRAATAPDPGRDRYVTEKTYRIHSDGSFLPCETDAAGVVTVPTAGPLELVGGEYDFYAYAPALEMTARPTLSVGHGTDFIATAPVSQRVAGRRTYVDLLFTHKAAQLHFTVRGCFCVGDTKTRRGRVMNEPSIVFCPLFSRGDGRHFRNRCVYLSNQSREV